MSGIGIFFNWLLLGVIGENGTFLVGKLVRFLLVVKIIEPRGVGKYWACTKSWALLGVYKINSHVIHLMLI